MRNPSTRPRCWPFAVACVALAVTALTATSCAQVENLLELPEATPPDRTAQAIEQLQALPSLEETKAEMQSALDEIIAEVGRDIPGIVWEPATTIGYETACAPPYEQTGGSRYRFPSHQARGEILQKDWDVFMKAAYPIGAKIGAVEVDGWSSEHAAPTPSGVDSAADAKVGPGDVTFEGPAHMVFTFRTEQGDESNLWIGGATGCRLSDGTH